MRIRIERRAARTAPAAAIAGAEGKRGVPGRPGGRGGVTVLIGFIRPEVWKVIWNGAGVPGETLIVEAENVQVVLVGKLLGQESATAPLNKESGTT